MPRRLIFVAIALSLLAAAVVTVYWGFSRLHPAQLSELAETQLSEALSAEVHVKHVRLRWWGGPRLVVRSLRAQAQSGRAKLRVSRAVARISPFSFLWGRVELRSVELFDAKLSIQHRPEADWPPTSFAELFSPPEHAVEPERGSLERAAGGILQAVRIALGILPPAQTLKLHNAELALETPWFSPTAPEPIALIVRHIEAELVQRRLSGDLVLTTHGRLSTGTAASYDFSLRAEHRREGALLAELTFADFALEELSRLLPAVRAARKRWSGTVSGKLKIDAPTPHNADLDLALSGRGIRGAWPTAATGEPHRIDLTEATADLRVRIRPQHIELTSADLRTGDFAISAVGSVARPARPEAALWLRAEIPSLSLSPQAAWLRRIFAEVAPPLTGIPVALRKGKLQNTSGEIRTSLGRFSALLENLRFENLDDMRFRTELVDVTVALEKQPLHISRAALEYTPDVFVLRDVIAQRPGRPPLPRLDLSLSGLSRRAAVPRKPPLSGASAPKVAGLAPAWKWLKAQITPSHGNATYTPQYIAFSIDWLHHPALVWPLEQVRATLQSQQDGFRFAAEHAVWGGVALALQGEWRTGNEPRLRVAAEVTEPERARFSNASQEQWLRGRIEVKPLRLTHWNMLAASGEVSASGELLHLDRLDASLRARGRMLGSIDLDLSWPDRVPCEAELQIEEGEFSEFAEVVLNAPNAATGTFEAWGSFHGHLEPQQPLAKSLVGEITLLAYRGDLRGNLPLIAALQTANKSYSEAESKDPVRFDQIYSEMRIEGGRIHIAPLSLDGPAVRLLASGEIDLLSNPHRVEAVVGMFLHRDLDRMIGKFPVVDDLFLGSDDNLLGAYFVLTGPWGSPNAQRIPNRTFASGPMGFVIKDIPGFMVKDVPGFVFKNVPGFVSKGFRSLQSAIGKEDENETRPVTGAPKPEGS